MSIIFSANLPSYFRCYPWDRGDLKTSFLWNMLQTAIRINILNPKFQVSSHLLYRYSLVCVGNTEDKFSHNAAHMVQLISTNLRSAVTSTTCLSIIASSCVSRVPIASMAA